MPRDPVQAAEETERVFSALSNASRRQILLTLHFRGGEMTAGEIAGRFACSWPTTTRHLNRLREAGLISVSKAGRERIYRLEYELLSTTLKDWVAWFDRKPDGGR